MTIVLVTHFMEEAERLCDRVALIDHGRVVALDTPARLATQARGGKTVRFLPSAPFEDRLLTGLPEVSWVEREGQHVVVTGTGELVSWASCAACRPPRYPRPGCSPRRSWSSWASPWPAC